MGDAITSLTIKGFKSIRSMEDFKLGSLNVLIGANGAGKSNFVSFFSLLNSLVNQELQLAVARHGGADAHLFLGPKITKEIVAKLYFGRNGYEFTLVPTSNNRLIFGDEVAYFAGDYGESRRSLGKGHDEARLREAEEGPRGSVPSYLRASLSSWTVYHFHDTSETAGVRRPGTTRDHERFRPDASNLAAFLLRLQECHARKYDLIRDTVRLVAPFFDDFKLRPQPNGADTMVQLEWTQKGSDYPFHPSQLSDGTLRFVCLATALLQPSPPTTMVFDEPELGLHPYALGVLAGLLRQASERTQVIVSTQSAPLLDHFDVDQTIVVDRRDGASAFHRLEAAALSEWLNDYSLGELWQKNVFEGGPANE
jgi:predicted ATPase